MRNGNASRGRLVAERAESQHGVVSKRELLELGLSLGAIQRWVDAGWLHRRYPGVYAVGHPKLTAEGRWLAAVKACGPGAVLSHQTGAALHAIRRSSSPLIHVTTPTRANPRGIRVRRVRRLHPEDVTVVNGIPVTSVARTLLDLAAVLSVDQLTRACEQAERLQLLDLNAISNHRRRPGTRKLRQALAGWTAPPDVRSDWERDLPDFCDRHGIPRPQLNQSVDGFLVDAFWRDKKLVVELDSWAFHRSPRAFRDDRTRYAKLQLAGHLVLPITKLDDEAAQMISAAVAAR
jgi:hypothetical protein